MTLLGKILLQSKAVDELHDVCELFRGTETEIETTISVNGKEVKVGRHTISYLAKAFRWALEQSQDDFERYKRI